MGLAVLPMVVIRDPVWAIVLLIFIGTLAGLFIVPMNALLQDRGHAMMGAGHSIAVQNFNENLSILTLLGVYALMLKADISIYLIVVWFSLFVSTTMWYLHRKHRGDRVT
jgi:ABC-type multidrug transport system fused ATPase/permease subunit